jgi:hypothetical protein
LFLTRNGFLRNQRQQIRVSFFYKNFQFTARVNFPYFSKLYLHTPLVNLKRIQQYNDTVLCGICMPDAIITPMVDPTENGREFIKRELLEQTCSSATLSTTDPTSQVLLFLLPILTLPTAPYSLVIDAIWSQYCQRR